MSKEYFSNTKAISNSQLWAFIGYNKYGRPLYTPDKYIALHIEKTKQFDPTDAVIIGKIVDLYFSGEGEGCWNKYIPVARRTGGEIKKVLEERLEWVEDDSEIERITTEVESEYMEITLGMKDDAEKMIDWGRSFRKFREFLSLPDTESQVELSQLMSIIDKDWVIHEVEVKWLPDFVNRTEKKIVDLKTTGNIEMIVDDLQFRGDPKPTARYIRQLSLYNEILGGDYSGVIALISNDGVKWIDIPNEYLKQAWEIMKQDIVDLQSFLNNPNLFNESIFLPSSTEQDLSSLTIS